MNLAFFGGNDVYWRTRYEPSIDGTNSGYRTLVCYKETKADAKIDPTTEWTGTFRDPRFPTAIGSNQPENGLIGTRFISNSGEFAIKVPSDYAALRFWRGTAVASLTGSQTATLAPNTLGYEFNDAPADSSRPSGLISLSRTTTPIDQYLADYGKTVLPGVATHNLTLYRASSGALVFSAGTIQWSWGLGMQYDGGPQPASQPMQQATLNLLADMSVPAATPLPGLTSATKSSDTTSPIATITGSSTGTGAGSRTVVTGTATDAGGVVAGVEVSTDNGVSWKPASGTSDWSYTFDAKGVRTMQVRARAIDDSGNIGATTDPTDVTSTCPCTMLGAETPAILGSRDDSASSGLDLGLRFKSSSAGTVTALRFFRGVGDSSTHVGRLFRSDGALLAQATFPSSTGQGWEEAALTTPIQLTANQEYVTTTHIANAFYAVTSRVFANGSISVSPLTALGSVYRYGAGGIMPTSSYQGENYFADVKFETGAPAVDITPPVVLTRTPSAGMAGVEPNSQVSLTFDEQIQNGAALALTTSSGSAITGTTTWDASTLTLTFKPGSSLPLGEILTVTPSGIRDLSGNVATVPTWSFTVRAVAGTSVFGLALPQVPSANDTAAVEVGTKITPAADGVITGIRYYKGSANTGTHVGRIYTAVGTKVAEVTFIGESASGWQTATLATPLNVTAGAIYTVSTYAPMGGYAYTSGFFASPYVSGDLTATAGVYRYGAGGTVPTSSWSDSNYWVDVLYVKANADTTAPVVTGRSPAVDATNVAVDATVSVTLDEPIVSGYQVTVTPQGGSPLAGTTAWDTTTKTLKFTPASSLGLSTRHDVTVTGLKDSAGNTTPTISWSFTTIADTTAPVVTGRSPAVDATNVAVDATVSVTLDEPIVSGYQVTVTPQGGSPLAGTTAWDTTTKTLKFTPTAALSPTTLHTVAVTGLQDSAGNTTPTISWSFTTLTPDTTAPVVTGRSPAVDATNVAVDATVSVTLDEPIVSGYQVTVTPQGGSPLAGTTAWDTTTKTLKFTPASSLGLSTRHDVTVTGLKDSAGNTTPTISWSFTTIADTTAPVVTGRSPAVDATNVAVDATVSVTLDEPIVSGYQVTVTPQGGSPLAGTTAWDTTTKTLKFTPTAALSPTTLHTVAVTGLQDSAGNTTPTISWSFTTLTPDTTAPVVTGRSPAVDATNVAVDATVSVTLDEPIVSGYQVTVTPQGGSPLAGTTAWDTTTKTLKFTPASSLGLSTRHDVTVTGLKDSAGNTTPTISWSFTTIADTTAPVVTGRSPAVDATNVAVDATVSVTLDEPIVSGYQVTVTPQGGSPLAGTTAWDTTTKTLKFTPTAALSPTTLHTVAVTGLQDSAGNTTPTISWSFTTLTPDTTAPVVTGRSPAVDATNVAVDATVSVTLDEPIVSGYQVTVTPQGGSPLAGTTAWDTTTKTLKFTPASSLGLSTRHDVTVTGLKDSAGNTTPTISWSFTTIADTTAPVVTGRSPAVDATNVAVDATVSVTLDEPIVSGYQVTVTPQGGSPLAGTTAWDTTTKTLKFTPTAALSPTTLHTVAVTGLQDSAGNTTPTISWSFTTLTPPPPAPTGLTATASATGVSLDWADGGTEVVGYNVYRSATATGTFTKVNGPVALASAWDDGLAPSGASFYRVTAVTAKGVEASPSGNANASMTKANLLANPSFELDANADGRPDSWTSSARFLRNADAVRSGSFAGRHSSTSDVNYTIGQTKTGLTAGTTYDLAGWVNIPATTDTFTFELRVQWRSSTATIGTPVTVATYSARTNGWVKATGSLVAPAGANRAVVNMVSTSLKGPVYVDDVTLR